MSLTQKNGEPTYEEMLKFFPEAPVLNSKVEAAIKNGIPYHFDAPIITPGGNKKFVQSIGRPVMENGKCVRLYGTTLDITERKNIELELKKATQQLQLIIDAVPSLIAYIDNDEIYRFANRSYYTWFGKKRDDYIGKKVKLQLTQEIYEKQQSLIQQALAGELINFESEIPDKAGNLKCF